MPNAHAVPMPSPPTPCDLGDRSLPGLQRPTTTTGIHLSGCSCLLAAITAVLASVFTFAEVKV
jgi:hypothetical protein